LFTGIIEEIGKVERLHSIPEGKLLQIQARKVLTDLSLGDSVAIDGVCLSVTQLNASSLSVVAVEETLNRTTFGQIKVGTLVNLERAMSASSRFGGHFVQGHIDGTGQIVSIRNIGEAARMSIQIPSELSQFIVEKGSIAINGVSLTIAKKNMTLIEIALIPLTQENTNLGQKRVGEWVNIEVDILSKYVVNLLKPTFAELLSVEKIEEWGYGRKK